MMNLYMRNFVFHFFYLFLPFSYLRSYVMISHSSLEQNPLPYFARFPEADILTSSDQVIPTVTDDRLEIWQQGECCVIFLLLTNI